MFSKKCIIDIYKILFASLSLFSLFFLVCIKDGLSTQEVIFRSKYYVSRNYEVQYFNDQLILKQGQEKLPLEMQIYNGAKETPSFKWFRIIYNGQILASEFDMHSKDYASKDLTGLIQGTDGQITVEAGGVPGSTLEWTLSSPQIKIDSIQKGIIQAGKQLMIYGENFSSQTNLNSVMINSIPATVLESSSNALKVLVPNNVQAGINNLQVSVGNLQSNLFEFSILELPEPELLSFDCWMAPPGGTLNITGRNFSPSANENHVFFDKVEAQVSSASNTELSVIVPNWSWGPSQLNIPVYVIVNGRRSKNSLPFDIGPMYHGATPQFTPQ